MTYDDLDYPRSPRDSRDYDPTDYEPENTNDKTNNHSNDDDYDMNSRPPRTNRTIPRRLPAYEPIHYPRDTRPPSIRPAYSKYAAAGLAGERRPALKAEANPVLGVFGLSIRTRERDLEDEFTRYGDVEKVVIIYDQRTDRSRGFGFITMRKTEDAKRAIEKLNGLPLHGRNIRVDFSATQKPHNPTPGEYMGAKRAIQDTRYGSRPPGPRDIVDRYDDRRRDERDRYSRDDKPYRNERDRLRSRSPGYHPPRRDYEDPYGGRSRRDDYQPARRRSPSPPPRRRRSPSPSRRSSREYDAPRSPAAQEQLRY